MVDIVQQVSTDIVLSDKSEAEAGTNNTKFMTPLRTKEAIDKNLVPFNAMSQSQFEAILAANNEEFAASGQVHFGKHESGKEVNPTKSGSYTALTTPNTLKLGKIGGAGDSKTDYAVVNVSGIIFNLTPEFVLSLPAHPTTSTDRMDMYGLEVEKVEISSASPLAYQGGLRGVGATVNLFTATEQQKKDFYAQNGNTTYFGADGKIYQYQIYSISFAGTTNGDPSPSEQGYTKNTVGDLWIKGNKLLLYFGNVNRLNSGLYHPSFNPNGSAKALGDTFWHNTAQSFTSTADCFNQAKLLVGSGLIASGKSGRPDGRYADAIYADGFGGVCRDMRYSANGLTPTDFAEADQRVKNGTYRGFELNRFTRVFASAAAATSAGYTIQDSSNAAAVVAYKAGNTSIGGSFMQTDVIGSPSNILATPQLANGWQGSWLPWIPNNTASPAQTRKILSIHNQVYSDNNGASWTNGVWGFNPATNAENTGGAVPANLVVIRPYQAFAKQTKHSPNAAVYGELGDAYAVTSHDKANGCLLAESATGLILKNNTGISQNTKSLLTKAVDSTGKPTSSATTDGITYSALTLAAPANASAGFKCVNYPTASNQQGFINYAYTELKHNGTNWGDDSKVTIVDNQSTKTDLNGNTVLVGTAQLNEPLGWIKNKV